MNVLTTIQHKPCVALLIDPDKVNLEKIPALCQRAERANFSMFLVGGSLVFNDINVVVQEIKKASTLPVYLFPGSTYQLSPYADGIFFTSLVSGRNAEYLIGQQVIAAPILKRFAMDVIPVAYILIDGGCHTSVEYMSHTHPIPQEKTDIILATAIAAEMLGFKMIYLEAGSGAIHPVSPTIIRTISKQVSIPVAVGGGIKNASMLNECFQNGANLAVIGTAIEEDVNNIDCFRVE